MESNVTVNAKVELFSKMSFGLSYENGPITDAEFKSSISLPKVPSFDEVYIINLKFGEGIIPVELKVRSVIFSNSLDRKDWSVSVTFTSVHNKDALNRVYKAFESGRNKEWECLKTLRET